MKGRSNPAVAAVVVMAICIVLCRVWGEGFLFGYRTSFVLTESMEPEIPVASLLIEKKRTKDMSLKTGDVISYSVDADGREMRITHRITAIEGGVIRTKGDANQKPDPWTVSRADVEAKVVTVVPYILPVVTGLVLVGLLLRYNMLKICRKRYII